MSGTDRPRMLQVPRRNGRVTETNGREGADEMHGEMHGGRQVGDIIRDSRGNGVGVGMFTPPW